MAEVEARIKPDAAMWERIDAAREKSGLTRDQVIDEAVRRTLGGQALAKLFKRVRERSDLTEDRPCSLYRRQLRPKFRKYLTLEEASEFVDALELLARVEEDPPSAGLAPVCRDPRDDYLIYLAEEVTAAFLVTGDKD